MKRRNFIQSAALISAGLAYNPTHLFAKSDLFPVVRPLLANRHFTSKAVEEAIKGGAKKDDFLIKKD